MAIQDLQAFLSPSGGTGRGEEFATFGAVAASVTLLPSPVGFDLMNKYLLGPLRTQELSDLTRSMRAGRWSAGGGQLGTGEGRPLHRMAPTGRMVPAGGRTLRPEMAPMQGPADPGTMKWRRQNELRKRKRYRTEHRQQRSSINRKFGRMTAFYKFAGLGILAEAAFQITSMLAKPGLSRAAQVQEEQLLADERPIDTPMAYTQRQRALLAIHDSQLGIRNVIGQEAGMMHR